MSAIAKEGRNLSVNFEAVAKDAIAGSEDMSNLQQQISRSGKALQQSASQLLQSSGSPLELNESSNLVEKAAADYKRSLLGPLQLLSKEESLD